MPTTKLSRTSAQGRRKPDSLADDDEAGNLGERQAAEETGSMEKRILSVPGCRVSLGTRPNDSEPLI